MASRSPETVHGGVGAGPTWNYASKAGQSTVNVSGARGETKDCACPRANARKPQHAFRAVGAFCPIRPNVLWAMDFQFDQTADGRNLKLLNIIDEFTREALATDVERLINQKGTPQYLHLDNGPEFVADVVAHWAKDRHITLVFAEPGCPWQNGWVESFNGRLRDELLNGEQFATLLEAKVVINDWRHDYNINRPHSVLGNLTPAAYTAPWRTRQHTLENSHS
jgi:transposase InsO family protein